MKKIAASCASLIEIALGRIMRMRNEANLQKTIAIKIRNVMTSGGIKDFEGENVIPGFSRALKMKVKFLEFYVMQQVYEAE